MHGHRTTFEKEADTVTNAFWAQFNYTKPFEAALEAEFGVPFGIDNTGGGCICLMPLTPLEGGIFMYIRSGVEGSLWTHDRREEYFAEHGHYDGFGVGTTEYTTGDCLSDANDGLAQTPDQLVALVKRALALVKFCDEHTMADWHRDATGAITESRLAR